MMADERYLKLAKLRELNLKTWNCFRDFVREASTGDKDLLISLMLMTAGKLDMNMHTLDSMFRLIEAHFFTVTAYYSEMKELKNPADIGLKFLEIATRDKSKAEERDG